LSRVVSLTTGHGSSGPVGQDLRAAFGLGEDDKHISTVDADGVAPAAMQALYRLALHKDEQIQKLAQQLEKLRGQVARLQPPSRSGAD
jgi:hypothetical protein